MNAFLMVSALPLQILTWGKTPPSRFHITIWATLVQNPVQSVCSCPLPDTKRLSYPTACPRIVSKDEWGGRPPKGPTEKMNVPVPFTVVHHGGSKDYCTTEERCAAIVRSYQTSHMDSNGWNDIGYNFVVGEDGNVFEGRGWEAVGAHAPTYNTKSIGICIIGDFTGTNTPIYEVVCFLLLLLFCIYSHPSHCHF